MMTDIRIGTLVPVYDKTDGYIRQILPHGFESFSLMTGCDNGPIDFAGLAKNMGMSSQTVTDPTQLSAVLKAAMASGVPNLVEVIVSKGFGE
jgi:benzoylformate decarboxylase